MWIFIRIDIVSQPLSSNLRFAVSCTSFKEAPSVSMYCVPSKAIFVLYENGGFRVFSCFVRLLMKIIGISSEKCIGYGK